jgi:4-hydroxy-tetrahydrodipicolinate synthase
MKAFEKIRGCGTALVTPFSADGSVDFKALKGLVEFQIESGIDFLVPCGTTGENPTLSHKEHIQVIGTVVKTAGNRVPVVGGAGGYNTVSVAETAKAVEEAGADAILSVTPYYNKPTQEGLYQHYFEINNAVNIPIILYNVPGRTGCNMVPDTVVRLAELKNIAAIKEASGNIDQITELSVKRPADFRLLSGDDGITLPMMALGFEGVISVVANQVPDQMQELAQLCLKGKFDRATALQKHLYPLMKANFIETNPIPVKAGLAMMGRIQEIYRLPLVKMGQQNREKLHAVMKKLDLVQ